MGMNIIPPGLGTVGTLNDESVQHYTYAGTDKCSHVRTIQISGGKVATKFLACVVKYFHVFLRKEQAKGGSCSVIKVFKTPILKIWLAF